MVTCTARNIVIYGYYSFTYKTIKRRSVQLVLGCRKLPNLWRPSWRFLFSRQSRVRRSRLLELDCRIGGISESRVTAQQSSANISLWSARLSVGYGILNNMFSALAKVFRKTKNRTYNREKEK